MAVQWYPAEERIDLPVITDDRLRELNARIRPLVRDEDGLWMIKEGDNLRTRSYSWDAQKEYQVTKAEEVLTVVTHHACGYHGFFKPSVAEVLATIQDNLKVGEIDAYWVDPDSVECCATGDQHRAATHLYRSLKIK